MRKWYGLDCETYDPLLKTAGWSWKYGKGELLCTSIYYPETEEKVFIQRTDKKKLIYDLLQDKEVSFIGANIIYDLGWLLYAYGVPLKYVKCSFIDVLIAESSLDEYANPSLDSLSKKYLGKGKNSYRIEKWITENVEGAKGDFRKYLRYAPVKLLKEYVESDAEYPYFIWVKQLPLLLQEHLTKRVKLDFDCIKPSLMFTINGFPIDVEQKKKNLALLTEARDSVKNEFLRKYKTKLLVNSPKQLASFLETQHIPYSVKITLKGKNGRTFSDYKEMDNEMHNAKKLVSSFRFEKRIPVAYIADSLAERTKKLLEEEGFIVTVNPNIDKKFLKAQRDNYPVLGLIQDWKDANSIISKFLSEDFDRFITDVNGVYKGRPQFNIAKAIDAGTISSRFSSQNFNCQQIPSKGSLTLNDTTYDFAKMTRGLFKSEQGKVLFKIDYSQVEYRLIVSIAVGQGAEEAREVFRKDKGTDFHQYVMDLTGLTRKYAKNMSFGVSFGMSVKSMAENFGWTLEHANEISEQYHEHLPFVLPTLQMVGDIAKQRGYIKTICGNKARLKNKNLAYTMLNRYTQGSGADIMKSAIVEFYNRELYKYLTLHTTVHDELDGSVLPCNIDKVIELEDIMENTVKLNIPLLAEAEFGMNWADIRSPQEWLEAEDFDKQSPLLQEAVHNYMKLKEGVK